MADIIALNKARKARARAAKRAEADENAVKFGQSKAERNLLTARAKKARRDLDGHERQ